jgi:hypothetical protein
MERDVGLRRERAPDGRADESLIVDQQHRDRRAILREPA